MIVCTFILDIGVLHDLPGQVEQRHVWVWVWVCVWLGFTCKLLVVVGNGLQVLCR